MLIKPSWCTWDKEEPGQPCATPGCLRVAPARRRPSPQAPRAAARRWTDLAEQLCGLEGRRLAAVLGLADEALSDAVELAKRIPRRNQGRRRQVNLVGKLLREQPDAESARLEARAPLHMQCDMRPAAHAEGDTRPTAASCPILPWLADRDRQASVGHSAHSAPGVRSTLCTHRVGTRSQGACRLCNWVGSVACARGRQRLRALHAQPEEPGGGMRRRLWRARCWAAARATAMAPSASPPRGTSAWSPTTRRGPYRTSVACQQFAASCWPTNSGNPVMCVKACDQRRRTVPDMGSSFAAWVSQEIGLTVPSLRALSVAA